MNTTGVRFEVLNKDNFDTWKIQMRAILIKNDKWGYVSGSKEKPEVQENKKDTVDAALAWAVEDQKAQSDIILAINPSELKQIKGCGTSQEIWKKLDEIYQSKGPM